MVEAMMQGDMWWEKETGQDRATTVHSTVEYLRQEHADRVDAAIRFTAIYEGRPVGDDMALGDLLRGQAEGLSLNVVRSTINTMRSSLATLRPRPYALTAGGTQESQDRAVGLTAYSDGAFYTTKAYELGKEAIVDAFVNGLGFLRGRVVGGKLELQRVYRWEVLWDDSDAYHGDPRCFYQVCYPDKWVLASMYPKLKGKILDLPFAESPITLESKATFTNRVEVIEAWHLPSSPGAKDGMHVICGQDLELEKVPWTVNRFPFARIAWQPNRIGIGGTGVVEELFELQDQLLDTAQNVREGHSGLGKTFVFVDTKSGVKIEDMTDQPLQVVEHSGQPPLFASPPPVPRETYQFMFDLMDLAPGLIGVSQAFSQARKPAALSSGRALRVQHDVDSQRQKDFIQRVENMYMDVADMYFALSAMSSEEIVLSFPENDALSVVKWSDVAEDMENFTLRVYPTGIMPTTPSGQIETAEDLLRTGLVDDAKDVKRLMDFPDLASELDPDVESTEYAKWQVEKMLRGEVVVPEPGFQDLRKARRLAVAAYCMVRRRDPPRPDSEALLRDFVAMIDDKEKELMNVAGPNPGQPGPGQPGPGQPGPGQPGPGNGTGQLGPNLTGLVG